MSREAELPPSMPVLFLVQTDPASGSIVLAFNGFSANTQDPVTVG